MSKTQNRCLYLIVVVAIGLAAAPALAERGAIPLWEPTVITQPGSYLVTRDISAASGPILDIQVGGVAVDLNGHTLSQSGTTEPTIGISVVAGIEPEPFRIANGTLVGGMYGIRALNAENKQIRLANLTIKNASEAGVMVNNVGDFEARGIIIIEGNVGFDLVAGIDPEPFRHSASISGSHISVDEDGIRCNGTICNLGGNVIRAAGTAIALLGGAHGSSVESNIINACPTCFNPQPEPPAVALTGSSNVLIAHNTIYGPMAASGQNHGLSVDDQSFGLLAVGNTIRGFGDDGIHVLSGDATLRGNVVSGNGGHGIYLGGLNNLAEGNHVGGNGGNGLWFESMGQVYRDNVLLNNVDPTGGPGLADAVDGGGNVQ